MTKKEREIGKSLLEAFKALSERKKEYLIGFAEGVAAASESNQEERQWK